MGGLLEALRAIPIFAKIIDLAVRWWSEMAKRKHEPEAIKRRQDKDSAVDAAIDGVIHPRSGIGLRDADGKAEQQPKVDSEK